MSALMLATWLFAALPQDLDPRPEQGSKPCDAEFDAELEQKLRTMLLYHGFSHSEMAAATGRSTDFVQRALDHFSISLKDHPDAPDDGPLLIVPYPGGRHPRIGFLEGAIDPRTDTKVSLVSPWAPRDYAVVDLPEAIWWEDELLFLAHTHIPTLWTKAGIELDPVPWVTDSDGSLSNRRHLPNGVTIDSKILPIRHGVLMELSLSNEGEVPLRKLRAQVCVLLRGLSEFQEQSNDWTTLQPPYTVRRSQTTPNQWLVTAWDDCHRAWANPECPCIHSDPVFPDCLPGQTVTARGVIAFVEADDLQSAIESVQDLDWASPDAASRSKAP